jgi:hypothetical protein
MMKRQAAKHRVVGPKRARRGGADRRERPAMMGDLGEVELARGSVNRTSAHPQDRQSFLGAPRISLKIRGQRHFVRIDRFHVDDSRTGNSAVSKIARPTTAAENEHVNAEAQCLARSLGVGDDVLGINPIDGVLEIDRLRVWGSDDCNCAKPIERSDGREKAGTSGHDDENPHLGANAAFP